jgi:hypothetical protein
MDIGDLIFDEAYWKPGIIINVYETTDKGRLYILHYEDGNLGNGWEHELKLLSRCRRSG